MVVPTDTLELTNILIECDLPREHAEQLATKLSEKFALAASEDDLDRRIESEREVSDARFEAMLARMDARFDQALIEINERFAQIDARFEQIDARFAQIDARFERLEERMDMRFQQVEDRFQRVHDRFERVDERFKYAQTETDNRFAQFEVRVYRAVAIGTGLILAAISIWGAFG